MSDRALPLTRRQASAVLLGGLLATSNLALSAPAPATDYARRLSDLAARIPFGDPASRLQLTGLAYNVEDETHHFIAVLRLTWPYGLRQRRFTDVASHPEQAFGTIYSEIENYFTALACQEYP